MQVYLADFGLARKYVMEGVHKTYKEEPAKAHDGTKEFTSIDAHKGFYCCSLRQSLISIFDSPYFIVLDSPKSYIVLLYSFSPFSPKNETFCFHISGDCK